MVFLAVTSQTVDGVGQRGTNIWHCDVLSNNAAAATAFITALKNFYTSCGPLFGTSTATTIGTQVVTVEDPPVIVPATPQVANGTVSSTIATPAQLAAVASWRTALAGRSFRGRTYLGPLVQGALNGQSLSSTANNAIGTASLNLITASDASTDFRLVVLSRWHNGVKRPVPIGTRVTSAQTNTRVETQRRRNR
jgi:hypothetical protein